MIEAHDRVVEAQFGPRARAYLESAVHGQGADLEAIGALAEKARPELALDLGAGGGHVACVLARHARRIIATDLSSEMLAAVAETAREKGLSNIETAEAPPERLPFADETFDFVASRYSAHHWRDFDAGLGQARRTLKRGGRAVFVDVYAPGQALFDTHLQAIELLRDHSHVRLHLRAMVRPARPRRLRHRGLPNLAPQDGFSRLDGAHANARGECEGDPRASGCRRRGNEGAFRDRARRLVHLDMLMIEASRA
jgi:SAM-dependent methyltransferase